jgi:ssRNA-specific RNase YbeY (16S rRNA maturation enzyme)
LHLVGYKDKKPAERARMRKKEEACLSLLKEVSRGT